MPVTYSTKPCRSGSSGRWLLACLGLPLLLLQVATLSAETMEKSPFYDTAKHGWFWYEEPPLEIDHKADTPETPAQKEPRTIPSLAAYSFEEVWDMHPDDFQKLLNELQKKAVQYPIEQNILEYLTIQDIARRKALAYTHAASYVTQKYTDIFHMNQVYPLTEPGVAARVQLQQEEIAATIRKGKNDHALIFFTAPNCSFCTRQQQILAYFEEKFGWHIKTVDLSRNVDAAARFNITVTPTLLLIQRGKPAYMPVATGVIPLSELERKLYQAIRSLRGETTGDTFMLYDFQKGSSLDPAAILNTGKPPWPQSPR